MAKTKYKVRFRYVWTVYYDLSTNGNVVVTNYKTKALAVRAMRKTLNLWLKDPKGVSEERQETIRALLSLGTESGVTDAASEWADAQEASGVMNRDTIWLDRTRLVLSRKKVAS